MPISMQNVHQAVEFFTLNHDLEFKSLQRHTFWENIVLEKLTQHIYLLVGSQIPSHFNTTPFIITKSEIRITFDQYRTFNKFGKIRYDSNPAYPVTSTLPLQTLTLTTLVLRDLNLYSFILTVDQLISFRSSASLKTSSENPIVPTCTPTPTVLIIN